MKMMLHGKKVIIILICILFAFIGCSKEPDEVLIKKSIKQIEAALEAKNRREVLSLIADDFSGKKGQYDRQGLNNLLRIHFLRNQKVSVLLTEVKVTLHPGSDRATVSAKALVTGSAHWLPERGRYYDVTMGWRKNGSDWQIVNSDW